MAKKSGLGKGLDALIPGVESQLAERGITEIPTAQIATNPRQPRSRFSPEELNELAASIREHGIIQPLIVTQSETTGNYLLIAGERRLLAAQIAELDKVPAIIRDASDQDLVEVALVENIQRADLGPLEAAEAFRQLTEDFHLSHEEIASRIGKSRVTVTNTLRLLKLPEDVKESLAVGEISEGHARVLLGLPSSQAQSAVLQTILKKNLTVRQTEGLVRKLSGGKKLEKTSPAPNPEINALEDRLRRHLGTRVTFKHRQKGGTIMIHYYSEEELTTLIDLILGESD